jgi:hypothetical protein
VRLSHGAYRHVKRGREFVKTVVRFLVNRMWLSLRRCGASTLRSYRIKSFRSVWDWQLAYRRTGCSDARCNCRRDELSSTIGAG